MARKTSVIWTLNKEEMDRVVQSCVSLAEVFRYFGLAKNGATYKILKRRLSEDGIDFSHIPLGLGSNRGRNVGGNRTIPLEDVMVKGSNYNTGNLKNRLLKNGMLVYRCSICGQEPFWNGKEMTLIMDHINGVRTDNHQENLRIVCANCNMQLPTTNGKNGRKAPNYCKMCGKKVTKNSKMCHTCSNRKPRRRHYKVDVVSRPSKSELAELISNNSWCAIGRMYGVSDNAIRKWAKGYELI